MTDKSSPSHSSSWLERLSQALLPEPKDRAQLVALLRDAHARQLLDEVSLGMIESALQFSELQARDILIPRAQMVTVNEHDDLPHILNTVITSGHSRFPVIGDTPDEIIGILLAKDLLAYLWQAQTRPTPFKIRNLLRQVSIIPESKRLNVLLQEFRNKHHHMAIVVDEYGGIAGLVTIEDVLEQIVGEIEDEHDIDDEGFIKKHSENVYVVKALTPIEEFDHYFHTHLADETIDTIGGLIIKTLGHLPKRGEKAVIGDFHFHVLHADNRRVRLLRVWKSSG